MNKKILITVALALVLTLALALPAFSQGKLMVPFTTGDLSQTISYEFEGKIDFEKQVGHLCNTGAEMKQAISGDGKLSKSSEIYMKAYFMDVMDSNSFVTAPDALRNMEVITAIELCAPAKHVFTEIGADEFSAYGFEKGDAVPSAFGYIMGWDWLLSWDAIEPLTRQIWATSVSADPGHTGVYMGGFKAAYGPYGFDDTFDNAWWFVDAEGDWSIDLLSIDSADWGEDFVGNYFGIEQFAYTSSGVTKRFTEISSPFSHAYFTNDLTVTGMASITEAFTMGNLDEGTAAATDWWDLF